MPDRGRSNAAQDTRNGEDSDKQTEKIQNRREATPARKKPKKGLNDKREMPNARSQK